MTSDQALAALRPQMFALAYRITGSLSDAEDVVQDALLRLHLATPKDEVRSLKAYLATITARLSLTGCAIPERGGRPMSASGCLSR